LTRRDLIALTLGASAATAACSRKLATRYFGWLFVASAGEKAIAVADLAEFRRASVIPLGEVPSQILRVGDRVFATCPAARLLTEIDTRHFKVGNRVQLPGRIVSAVTVPDSNLIVAAIAQPAALVVIDSKTLKITGRMPLTGDPSALDVTSEMAVVAADGAGTVARVSLKTGKLLGVTNLGDRAASMRFRRDGKAILVGLPRSQQIVSMDAATGGILSRLPLRFAPGRFCFNADGGQMFVTGAGEDAIAIVSPFQSQVDQTIVGGRTPYAMAVSTTRNQLLITNPDSGDLTILDIDTRKLSASVHVGGNPGEVLLTPDEEYALVLNRDEGDVSVIRMNTVLDKTIRTKPLFTVFQMGSSPQSAIIIPKEA